MTLAVLMYLAPGILGFLSLWSSGKCKGKNAKNFFKLGGWGFWLLYLFLLNPIFPFAFPLINMILLLIPSAICFFMAATNILKEIRAQKNGEYTEAA